MHRFCTLLLPFALAACGNTVASLRYTPPAPLWTAATPSIGAVSATDQRKEAPMRLATIMGMYGNPLKTLDTAKSVKDEVADAFMAGLRARGLLTSSDQAPFHLDLLVRKFDADMIVGRTARIDITMSLSDRAGRVIYQDSAIDSESDMKFLQTGVFADIGDLQVLAQTVLDRTVNKMLDKPDFRAALERGGR
jgi:uncharacterized lipoprotein YajG